MMDFEEDSKNRSVDRIITLRVMDGKKPTSSTGLVDPRLFNGTNQLHAVQEISTGLWYLRYEQGAVPQVLKQKFTKFSKLLEFATNYFKERNIEIVEVID